MSWLNIDKITVLNVVAAFIVVVYVVFMFLYPERGVPAGLIALANMAIAYLFTITGYAQGLKTIKNP